MQKVQSVIHNKAHRESKRFSIIKHAAEMKKAYQKRSESVKVVPFHGGHGKQDSILINNVSRKQSIVGIYEVSENSISDASESASDDEPTLKGDYDEIDFIKRKTKEMY